MKKLTLIVGLSLASSALAAPAAPKFALKGDATKGEATFKQLCVPCHGEKGDGTGPAGAALDPKPTNFTDPANSERLTDEWVYKMVKDGGQANGKSPLMISWAAQLNDGQIRDVAAYILKFKPAKGKAAPKKTK